MSSRVKTNIHRKKGQSSDPSENASGVFGSGSSAVIAASERGSEKEAGAFCGSLERAEEYRQILGVLTSMCSAISSSTRGLVVDGEGGQ